MSKKSTKKAVSSLDPVKEEEMPEEKQEKIVDGVEGAAQKSVNDRGNTDVLVTDSADNTANKSDVARQSNPGGDRFTSTEAPFSSTEAPMDIYPKSGRAFGAAEEDEAAEEEEPKDPDILDTVATERDYQALLIGSSLDREAMLKAVRVVAKNPHISPDGPTDMFGTPLQRPRADEPEAFEQRVGFPPAEFDTNRVRPEVPPSTDAINQDRAENAVEESLDALRDSLEEKK